MADDPRPEARPDAPRDDNRPSDARQNVGQDVGQDGPAPDDVTGGGPDSGTDATAGTGPEADPETADPEIPDPEPGDSPGEDPDDTPQDAPEAPASEAVAAPDTDPDTDPDLAPDLAPDPPPGPPPPPRTRPPCTAGLFGKLPARGDFITRNIPHALQRPFEDWLIPLVQETRSLLGADWTPIWRAAAPWRFWIGPDVLAGSWQRDLPPPQHGKAQGRIHGGAISGVLLPSADRHGRDFPLVLVLADALARLLPPPVIAPPDRDWYALCDQLLIGARAAEAMDPVLAALEALPGPLLPDSAEAIAPLLDRRALWAQADSGEDASGDPDRIWTDIARADHHLAASGRSYWWRDPRPGTPEAACVLSFAGLPDAQSLAFMLARSGAA